jgi:hypothetical protein
MKHFFTLAVCLSVLFACNSSKESTETTSKTKTNLSSKNMQALPQKIEMEIVSRGFYNALILQDGLLTVKNNREDLGKTLKLNSNQLQEFKVAYNQFELSKLDEYLPTTNKRFSDASKASSIKITKNNVEFFSNDFDTNNPPLELSDLVKLLVNSAATIK